MLVRDSGGCSALHLAAQNGHTDLVSFILQQGEKLDFILIHLVDNVDDFYDILLLIYLFLTLQVQKFSWI